MNSIYKVYSKLKREYEEENISYDETENSLSTEKYSIKATETDNEISVDLAYEEQKFHMPIINCGLLYEFLCDVFDEKIKFSRISPRNIEISEWCAKHSEKEYGKKLKIKRIISMLLGVTAVIFTLVMFRSFGSYYVLNKGKYDVNDVSVLLFLAGVLITGVSGIHHALVRKPISTGRALGFSIGMILASFGISTLYLTVAGKNLNETNTFSGIVLFTFSTVVGLGAILLSLFKKINDHKYTLTRIIEMPSEEDRLAVIEKLKEQLTENVILINKTEDEPKLTGSKFGGVPYWDMKKEYPLDRKDNPMSLYLQADLSELPENDKFDKSGLLQFFISNNADYDECRVVYHSEISENTSEEEILEYIKSSNPKNAELCIIEEKAISFENGEMINFSNTEKVNDEILSVAEELGIKLDKTISFDEILTDEEYKELTADANKSRLLGYSDIKLENYDETEEEYNRILLSVTTPDNDLNLYEFFFISEQALSDKNYSDVKFYSEMV